MAGRKPKPTELKKLAGNPGKRKLNQHEPRYGGAPICPEWMPDEGKAMWCLVVPELIASGVLAKVDLAAVVGYCESYATVEQSRKIINAEGLILEGRKHPAFNILDAAKKELRAYGSLLGLDPSSRSKLAVKPHDDKQNDDARFFGEEDSAVVQ